MDDELLIIDTQPVQELSLMEIRERLSQAGQTVLLERKSGEREYAVVLQLARPYESPPQWEPEDPAAVLRPFPELDN